MAFCFQEGHYNYNCYNNHCCCGMVDSTWGSDWPLWSVDIFCNRAMHQIQLIWSTLFTQQNLQFGTFVFFYLLAWDNDYWILLDNIFNKAISFFKWGSLWLVWPIFACAHTYLWYKDGGLYPEFFPHAGVAVGSLWTEDKRDNDTIYSILIIGTLCPLMCAL